MIEMLILEVEISALHAAQLPSLGPTQAEVFADINIWAVLWDFAFLKSRTLIINRFASPTFPLVISAKIPPSTPPTGRK